MPGPGIEPPTSGMPSGCDNHYTTAPLNVYIVDKFVNGAEGDDMHTREDPEVARDLQLAIDLPECEEVKASVVQAN